MADATNLTAHIVTVFSGDMQGKTALGEDVFGWSREFTVKSIERPSLQRLGRAAAVAWWEETDQSSDCDVLVELRSRTGQALGQVRARVGVTLSVDVVERRVWNAVSQNWIVA